MSSSDLIIAAMRLPITLVQEDSRWKSTPSPGGLATALRSLASRRRFTWVGWPGTYVPRKEREEVALALKEAGDLVPVHLSRSEIHHFYEEFSNRTLWPLFHSFQEHSTFSRESWNIYQEINGRFANALAESAPERARVWVHDYQLALVPQYLRKKRPDLTIGFFLHIPFPSQEIYRTLAVRDEILQGILGADLIGFHTYSYVTHFRAACLRTLGIESTPAELYLPTRTPKLSVRPIGISPQDFYTMTQTPAALEQKRSLEQEYKDKKVVIGVDRLDYTKGIPQRLAAFAEFLERYPEHRNDVVLVQVASPSRTKVQEYQDLKREIDEMVGDINGRFGSMGNTPVVYINQHVPQERLVALYQVADVALITPLRDGMNLVALEFVAARATPATLILSEFTGAASNLPGAVLVNPYNPSGVAESLAQALRDGPSEDNFAHMTEYVHTQTSQLWAERFVQRLEDVSASHHAGPAPLQLASRLASVSGRVLFLLDYDGTLTPHVKVPSAAKPSDELRSLLADLADRFDVWIVSGRPAAELEAWLGDLALGLVCEHGLSRREVGGAWTPPGDLDVSAIDEVVLPLLHDFVIRTPGSKIERKRASVAWHYRGADPELGAWRARELHSLLDERLTHAPMSVLLGSRVVEIRHAMVSKRHAATNLLEDYADAAHVVCVGDDKTDEEMFEAIVDSGRSSTVCRVGTRMTIAPYYLKSVEDVLRELASVARPGN